MLKTLVVAALILYQLISYADKHAKDIAVNPHIENLLTQTSSVILPKRKPINTQPQHITTYNTEEKVSHKRKEELQKKQLNNSIEYVVSNMKDRISSMVGHTKDKKQILCIAKNIYFESRSEDQLGRTAVAMVTLNRAKRSQIPPCDVVHQKNDRGCQFSWVCQLKTPKDLEIRDMNAWKESLVIAYLSFKDALDDFSNGATHYYNPNVVKPDWERSMEPINNAYMKNGILGNHRFLIAANYR